MNLNNGQVIMTSKPQRFRTSKAKARTGCITCKFRKVKCDEKKPGCARCEAFGFSCGGYLAEPLPRPLQKKVDSKAPEVRYIRPRPSQIPGSPSISLPCDETEGRYFRFFQEDAMQSVSGYLGSEFWSSIVLQESHYDSPIRHSILAIGALFKSSSSYGFPNTGHIIQDEHQKFAVQQYSLAASTLRHRLSQKGLDLIRAVEACLLLTCFEAIQGNVDACLVHIRFGLALLEQAELQRKSRTNGRTQLLADARIYRITRTFARIGIQRLCSIVPINGWDRDILSLPRKHITTQLSITNISTFTSISEASESWDIIMSQVTGLYRRALYQSYKNPGSTSSAFIEEQGTLSSALKDWQLAFEPLRCDSRVKPSDAEALVLMRVYNLLAQILLAASIDTSEMRYDDFTENFEEIVMLCQSLAQHHNDLKFSFDVGIIPPLNIAASKCRVPRIRDRAISILRTSARREGVFDGILSARVCEWMAAEEMKGYEKNKIIPVEARLSIGGFKWNVHECWVWIRCSRPVVASQGGVTRIEKTLKW